jgi:tRNA G18 (ribose-2'-O)-methylase SpoU
MPMMQIPEIRVLLSLIRSAHNVGAIFRTCDGAGVSKLYLGGYTPAPIDRFGRVVDEIKKTSLGATESVPWESVEDELALVVELKKQGFSVVAVEQHERSVPYTDISLTKPALFIFGNEIDGVSKELIDVSDAVVSIPMRGMKESLNVATSVGIVLFDAVNHAS